MTDELFWPEFIEAALDRDAVHLVACSLAWNCSGNIEAGYQLVHSLASSDPLLHAIAETGLLERGAASLSLIEEALVSGQLRAEDARSCLQKIAPELRQTEASQTGHELDI
jgi:hypothetical protein